MVRAKGFSLDASSPTPLYEQLAEGILARIRRGEYEVGKPLPAINALEGMVNASRITVVRALKELAARGVISARGTRGYYVNPRGNPVHVGLVVPLHTVFMSIYAKLHAALQLAVRRKYGSLVVASSDEDPRVFRERVTEMAYGQGIRKLALVPPSVGGSFEVHPDALRTVREICALPGMRVVVMDRTVEPDGFSVLRQNRESGYRQAIALLVGLGYRRILLINPAAGIEAAHKAVRGMLAGASVRWITLPRVSEQEVLERALTESADAVILGDLAAALVLQQFGSVPFALVGYDASVFTDACPVQMTSVDSNLKEMGRAAFDMLESGRMGVSAMVDPFIRAGATTPRVDEVAGSPRRR